jgi:hypothetical protein
MSDQPTTPCAQWVSWFEHDPGGGTINVRSEPGEDAPRRHLVPVDTGDGWRDWWNPETGHHVTTPKSADQQYHDFDVGPWSATDTESMDQAPQNEPTAANPHTITLCWTPEQNFGQDSVYPTRAPSSRGPRPAAGRGDPGDGRVRARFERQ